MVNTLEVTPAGTVSVANPALKNTAQPNSITGLIAWWKADALTLNNGVRVSSWTDSSTSGRNATQNNDDFRPTFITNEVNSLPVVRFDGVNDNLNLSIISTLKTVFVVMKWADPTNYGAPILGDSDGASVYFYSGLPNQTASQDVVIGDWAWSTVRTGGIFNNGMQLTNTTLMRDKENFQIITLVPVSGTQAVFDNIGKYFILILYIIILLTLIMLRLLSITPNLVQLIVKQ